MTLCFWLNVQDVAKLFALWLTNMHLMTNQHCCWPSG